MSTNPNYTSNPFTPLFGATPKAYIHRYEIENRILNEFCAKDAPMQAYMIMGARGAGKTVLMHELANRFESFDEWVVVRMNPNADMIDAMLAKLSGNQKVSQIIKTASINLSFFGLGVEMSTEPIRDKEDAIATILKRMQKDEKKLLVIVDEAVNTASMKTFASAYQNFLGQNLPIYVLMTGLYEHINSLRNENNMTFLYRMPRLFLEPLQLDDIALNYKECFMLSDSESVRMAEYTKGYSYGFQLLGKLTWEADGQFDAVQEQYKMELYEVVYDKIWDEASDTDRDVLYSAAISESNSVKDIRKILEKGSNEFSPYSDRLKKKGVVYSPQRGSFEIALPYFTGYIRNRYRGKLKRQKNFTMPDGF